MVPVATSGALRVADVRRRNRAIVLAQLRDGQRWSRADLARSTTLTTEGIRELLTDLIADRLVLEVQASSPAPRRGRPPTYYELNACSGAAVGVSIGRRYITAVLTDAAGTEVGRREVEVSSLSVDSVVSQISEAVEVLVAPAEELDTDFLSVCLSIHGDVDPETGVVHEAPAMGWVDVGLAELVDRQLGRGKVRCIDGARATTVAVHREGVAKGRSDVVVLDLSNWLAAGLILNGSLYTGAIGLAGQIGTCPVPSSNGPSMLSATASGRAVVNRYRESGHESASVWRDVVDASRSGDPAAAAALEESGLAIVAAGAWLVGCFGPELLVLGGAISDLGPAYVSQIITDIYANCGRRARGHVEIVGSVLGRDAWVRGAVHVALDIVHEQQQSSIPTARAS